ncbi:hypothetical protein G6F35_017510 [Rhizopus arrhizus]|nr:hypothetical protein G6F35_017510 [Rhizopus arrhizus]
MRPGLRGHGGRFSWAPSKPGQPARPLSGVALRRHAGNADPRGWPARAGVQAGQGRPGRAQQTEAALHPALGIQPLRGADRHQCAVGHADRSGFGHPQMHHQRAVGVIHRRGVGALAPAGLRDGLR